MSEKGFHFLPWDDTALVVDAHGRGDLNGRRPRGRSPWRQVAARGQPKARAPSGPLVWWRRRLRRQAGDQPISTPTMALPMPISAAPEIRPAQMGSAPSTQIS